MSDKILPLMTLWAVALFFKESIGAEPIFSVGRDEISIRQIGFYGTTVIGCTNKGIVTFTDHDSLQFIQHPFVGYGLSRICGIDSLNRVWLQADTVGSTGNFYFAGISSILVRWDGKTWEKPSLKDSLYAVYAWVDKKGRVFATELDDSLTLIADGTVSRYSPPVDSGYFITDCRCLGVDNRNNAWYSVSIRTPQKTIINQMRTFNGAMWSTFDTTNSMLPNLPATSMSFGSDSQAIVYYSQSPGRSFIRKNMGWEQMTNNFELPRTVSMGADFSLAGIERDSSIKTVSPDGRVRYYLKSSLGNTLSLAYDKTGCLWASTDQYEFIKIDNQKIEKYALPSLRSNYITSVVKFRDQLIVGTMCGLSISGETGWKTYGNSLLGTNTVNCLLVDSLNVWIGTQSGLFTYNGIEVSLVEQPGCPFNKTSPIRSLYKCRDGTIWVGGNMTLAKYGAGVWKAWTPSGEQPIQGRPLESVRAIIEAPDGAIWLSAFSTGILKYDGTSFTGYGFTQDPLRLNAVSSFCVSSEGQLWAVSDNAVKFRFLNGQWDSLPPADDPYYISNPSTYSWLFCKQLPSGSVFMAGPEGIVIAGKPGRQALDKYDLGPSYGAAVRDVWVESEDSVYVATMGGLLVCKLPVGKTRCRAPRGNKGPRDPMLPSGGRAPGKNNYIGAGVAVRAFTLHGKLLAGGRSTATRGRSTASGVYFVEARSTTRTYRGKATEIR